MLGVGFSVRHYQPSPEAPNKKRLAGGEPFFIWWLKAGSNRRPERYECSALTI
jgi:hypothetical protein